MKANSPFEPVRQAVMQLDLSPIKRKLMHAASGEGWNPDKADTVEQEYRRFLCLTAAYPDETIVPTVDVDTFWHYHILDTMKYAADCQQAFGYFVHHDPYVGLHGEDDEQVRIDSSERTRTLYEAMFGVTQHQPSSEAGPCGMAAAAWCASPGARDGSETAWCASPGTREDSKAAWCASPGARKITGAGNAMAWCASPGAKDTVQARATAWCASPGARRLAAQGGNTTAWCASPGVKNTAHRS